MFRQIFVGPFGTEFDFPTLEQVAAVLLGEDATFIVTSARADDVVECTLDHFGKATCDYDYANKVLGFMFSPRCKVEDIIFDDACNEYIFTLCEDCE